MKPYYDKAENEEGEQEYSIHGLSKQHLEIINVSLKGLDNTLAQDPDALSFLDMELEDARPLLKDLIDPNNTE